MTFCPGCIYDQLPAWKPEVLLGGKSEPEAVGVRGQTAEVPQSRFQFAGGLFRNLCNLCNQHPFKAFTSISSCLTCPSLRGGRVVDFPGSLPTCVGGVQNLPPTDQGEAFTPGPHSLCLGFSRLFLKRYQGFRLVKCLVCSLQRRAGASCMCVLGFVWFVFRPHVCIKNKCNNVGHSCEDFQARLVLKVCTILNHQK